MAEEPADRFFVPSTPEDRTHSPANIFQASPTPLQDFIEQHQMFDLEKLLPEIEIRDPEVAAYIKSNPNMALKSLQTALKQNEKYLHPKHASDPELGFLDARMAMPRDMKLAKQLLRYDTVPDPYRGHKDREILLYPSAGFLAKHFLRPMDSIFVAETDDKEFQTLRNVFSGDRRVQALQADMFGAVRTVAPPMHRSHGVVWIDPDYFTDEEPTKIEKLIEQGFTRWPDATYVVTYPILHAVHEARWLYRKMCSTGFDRVMGVEMIIDQGMRQYGLTGEQIRNMNALDGCIGYGMAVINPPRKLEWVLGRTAEILVKYLADPAVSTTEKIPARYLYKPPGEERMFDMANRANKLVPVHVTETIRGIANAFFVTPTDDGDENMDMEKQEYGDSLLSYPNNRMRKMVMQEALRMRLRRRKADLAKMAKEGRTLPAANEPWPSNEDLWPRPPHKGKLAAPRVNTPGNFGMPVFEHEVWMKQKRDYEQAIKEGRTDVPAPPASAAEWVPPSHFRDVNMESDPRFDYAVTRESLEVTSLPDKMLTLANNPRFIKKVVNQAEEQTQRVLNYEEAVRNKVAQAEKTGELANKLKHALKLAAATEGTEHHEQALQRVEQAKADFVEANALLNKYYEAIYNPPDISSMPDVEELIRPDHVKPMIMWGLRVARGRYGELADLIITDAIRKDEEEDDVEEPPPTDEFEKLPIQERIRIVHQSPSNRAPTHQEELYYE